MKVSKLIKELQKMPKNSEVYFRAHGNLEYEYEYDGRCNNIRLVDFDNIPDDKKETAMNLTGKVVMIRE